MGAVFVQDPDRPGIHLAAAPGMDEAATARLADEVAIRPHPFTLAATTRESDVRSRGHEGRWRHRSSGPTCLWSCRVAASTSRSGRSGSGGRRRGSLDATRSGRHWARWPSSLAVAVDRARLGSTAAERSEWFERMAHTDLLTGLANERTIGRILELELARAGRQGSEVSLAMFDVDDFRETNDDGGSEAGDDVLRQVAAVLAESVRLVDTVGRIGGDEFVLVAPGSAGAIVAQRVIDGIAALPPIGGRRLGVGRRRPVPGRWGRCRGAHRGRDRGLSGRGRGRGSVGSGVGSDD